MSKGSVLSRRKLAKYIADNIQSGNAKDAVQKTAAYLIETKQTRNVDLLVRDVEQMLTESGIVVADVTSARPIGKEDKAAIAELLGAEQLHVREIIDPSVLGGLRVEVVGKRLDATLKHKIDSLKEIDSRKGTK